MLPLLSPAGLKAEDLRGEASTEVMAKFESLVAVGGVCAMAQLLDSQPNARSVRCLTSSTEQWANLSGEKECSKQADCLPARPEHILA